MAFKIGDLFVKLGLKKDEFDKGLDESMKKTDEFSKKTTDSSNKATKGFNGLQFQVNQFARELPNLGFGINMFIASISNNLPMLTEEIKKAKEANKQLAESGQKGIPIWKQLGSAIVSWQTALIAGITLAVVYGRDIQTFVSELFKGTSAIDSMSKAMRLNSESAKKLNDTLLSEVTNLKLRFMIMSDIKKSDDERKKAAQELINMFPDILSNYSAEQLMLNGTIDMYNQLRDVIIKTIEARFAEQQIMENYKKIAIEQKKIENGTWYGNAIRLMFGPAFVSDLNNAAINIDKLRKANEKLFDSFSKNYKIKPFFGKSNLLDEVIVKGQKNISKKTARDQLNDLKKINDELEAQRILRMEFKGEKIQPITPLYQGVGDLMLPQKSADTTGIFGNLDSHYKTVSENRKKWTEEELQAWTDFTGQLNQIIQQGLLDVTTSMAEGFGKMIGTGNWNWDNFGLGILDSIGKFMQQLGTLFVAYGIANLKFVKALTAGPTPLGAGLAIAAGVGLIAAGAAISSFSQKGMSGGASASIAASGYSPSGSSSAVAAISGNVVFELEGTKLRGVLNNQDRKNNLIR